MNQGDSLLVQEIVSCSEMRRVRKGGSRRLAFFHPNIITINALQHPLQWRKIRVRYMKNGSTAPACLIGPWVITSGGAASLLVLLLIERHVTWPVAKGVRAPGIHSSW
jgi:hypothetical protein